MWKYIFAFATLCVWGGALVLATPLEVVITEVAWMGTKAGAADEWIELHNPGTTPIDLTGWVLRWGKRQVRLRGRLEGHGYFLLERSDDHTVADVDADLVYTGGLSNAGEVLELLNAQGSQIDVVNPDGGPWPAGDSSQRASMQRLEVTRLGTDDNWRTVVAEEGMGLDAKGQAIVGTPRQPNRPVPETPTLQRVLSSVNKTHWSPWMNVAIGLGMAILLVWLMWG